MKPEENFVLNLEIIMSNSDKLFAVKIVANYQFTNGSNSSLNHLIAGSNIEEIFDTFIYCFFSSHNKSYDDDVVWFKSVDALNKEKSNVDYNHYEKCLFAHFIFDDNPLMMRSSSLYIDKVCYFGLDSAATNNTVEFLEKFKVHVFKAKDCNKFKYMNEHESTLEHEAIINLKKLFNEYNKIDANYQAMSYN